MLEQMDIQESTLRVDHPTNPDGGCCCGKHSGGPCCGRHSRGPEQLEA